MNTTRQNQKVHMDNRFEEITKYAFDEELKKIADFYTDMLATYPDEEEEPEYEEEYPEQAASYDSQRPNPIPSLFAGAGTGTALASGLGMLSNNILGNPISQNFARNAIIGGLMGGLGAGIPILINHFSSSNNNEENDVAAQPINSIMEN